MDWIVALELELKKWNASWQVRTADPCLSSNHINFTRAVLCHWAKEAIYWSHEDSIYKHRLRGWKASSYYGINNACVCVELDDGWIRLVKTCLNVENAHSGKWDGKIWHTNMKSRKAPNKRRRVNDFQFIRFTCMHACMHTAAVFYRLLSLLTWLAETFTIHCNVDVCLLINI